MVAVILVTPENIHSVSLSHSLLFVGLRRAMMNWICPPRHSLTVNIRFLKYNILHKTMSQGETDRWNHCGFLCVANIWCMVVKVHWRMLIFYMVLSTRIVRPKCTHLLLLSPCCHCSWSANTVIAAWFCRIPDVIPLINFRFTTWKWVHLVVASVVGVLGLQQFGLISLSFYSARNPI